MQIWAGQIIEMTIIALVMVFIMRIFIQNFHIDGQSMEPTLHDQEYVLVNKGVYLLEPPQRGDIIVFQYPLDPQEDYVKRIVAIPGDIVSIVGQTVIVNGVVLHEPYIDNSYDSNPYPSFTNRIVGPNEYFVLGDNRGNSSDSRAWGFVPRQDIIGKVVIVYWPFNENNFGILPDVSGVFVRGCQ
jgi:signal peptidase I